MVEAAIFTEIGVVMVAATALAFIARLFRQPLIPAYVAAGFLLGPIFGFVQDTELIITLSEIGIAFLLFIVGLEMDVRKLRSVSGVSIFGGLAQVVALFGVTLIIMLGMGFSPLAASYLGIVVALSSTMVVVKLLSDKKELDTLHGRIIIGTLLLQDIVAIVALTVMGSLGVVSWDLLFSSLLKGIVLFVAAILLGKLVLPRLFHFAARSQELFFNLSVSAAFLFALVFLAGDFSVAIGAFIAGVLLATLSYDAEIISKVKPLRDFFALMFFVSLGLQLQPEHVTPVLLPVGILFLLVLILKPLVIMTTVSFFRYRKHTSFRAGLSLGQVSEFSLILVASGLALGHISDEIFAMIILLAVLSILSTSYLFAFDDALYRRIGDSRFMRWLDRLTHRPEEEQEPTKRQNHVILCGCSRTGSSILRTLQKLKRDVIVVDYDPKNVKRLKGEGVDAIYGDIEDEEVITHTNLEHASMLISTVPSHNRSRLLIRRAREQNSGIIIFVTASSAEDALKLYEEGADYVILPHYLGGEYVSLILEESKDNLRKVLKRRLYHKEDLEKNHRGSHA